MPKSIAFSAVTTAVISFGIVFCDFATADTLEREDLYAQGQKAYSEKDYVTALKDLYAFEILNEKQIQSGTSDAAKQAHANLDQAITDSETKLHTIVRQWSHEGETK